MMMARYHGFKSFGVIIDVAEALEAAHSVFFNMYMAVVSSSSS